jgi:hypothetical protein
MKRLVPLWITAIGGFVLIVAYFIPLTQGWGEVAAIWFDILAAIAFILGGGNLLKTHLKKVSDKVPGWGYSVLTIVAFLTMLAVGLLKVGAPPAPNQEYYGESFAHVPVSSVPDALVVAEPGHVPVRPDDERIHASVRRQLRGENGEVTFRGWMLPDQKTKLLAHSERLEWQCTAEKLFAKAVPAEPLRRGRTWLVKYYADHEALAFRGHMSEEQRDHLKGLRGADPVWQGAVDRLFEAGLVETSVIVADLPPFFDPASPGRDLRYDQATHTLTVTGPMHPGQRDQLADLFPRARPFDDARAAALLQALRDRGPVHPRQAEALRATLAGLWKVDLLAEVLNAAGKAQVEERSACDCLEDQKEGLAVIPLTETIDEDQRLNQAQVSHLHQFVAEPAGLPIGTLLERLSASGPIKEPQANALFQFFETVPTEGELKRDLCFAMMHGADEENRSLTLTAEQQIFLLNDYRRQSAWRQRIGELLIAAHVVKYPWSGEYRAQGTPFWWLYEYTFKPLQATIFAMLAFYVASAAFRAFRAKNVEAILLLGTAFVILLGRTYAGVVMTSWLPKTGLASELRIENITVTIMKVFNTAGSRAIMIGIALGIASTSLKVLLGVDRSYLGSGKD